VFGNKDRNGDKVMPGAFAKTLERWKGSGQPIPVIWSHSHGEPQDYIGEVDPADVRETPQGLVVAGKLFVDDNPRAANIFDLMKRGLIRQWSFAYQSTKDSFDDGTRLLEEVDLFEVGPTLIGANPEATTLALKSLDIEDKAVDNSPWDGNAAMGTCNSAADYRSICAGEHTYGEPDQRQHWALPHHARPGAPPNAAGVRNSLSRLPQTQQLANPGAARAHLEAHMRQINPQASFETEMKLGRSISAATAMKLRSLMTHHEKAMELLSELLADGEGADAKLTEAERARLDLASVDTFLSERGR